MNIFALIMKPHLPILGLMLAAVATTHGSELAQARAKLERKLQSLPITAHFDLPYADTDNPKQKLDLFLPKDRRSTAPLPVVVYIHGGAWKRGDKVHSGSRVLDLVSSGDYAAVTVSYRLCDEAKWPAQIHDCKAVIRWVRGNAAKFGLNPERIGVWGNSAGGHLVSLLGTSGDVKELEGDLGNFPRLSSRVSCVVNQWGPQDLTQPLMFQDGKAVVEDPAVTDLLGGPSTQKRAAALAASPVTHVTSDDPPFLTLHGTEDQRVAFAHGERIHAALTGAGVTSLLIPVVGGEHGVTHPEIPERIRAFLDRYLAGRKAEVSTKPIQARP
jgi:acetyl esterase/lipase